MSVSKDIVPKEQIKVASRLYSTTRRLYLTVVHLLAQLGIREIGSPTKRLLIALYVTGLILLDVRQTQTRVTRFLPGRCHDAINRLLRVMRLSTRCLMKLMIRWILRQAIAGYLCLDDVIVEKAFASCHGRLGLTPCQETQGVWTAYRCALVVQSRRRLADTSCLPALATQTLHT